MFEIFFLGLFVPVLSGATWGVFELTRAHLFPVIHERRHPWPNPFG